MPPPPNRSPLLSPNASGISVTSNELIDMVANQSIAEESSNNGGVEVVGKVNINFGGLKLNDSKKRLKHPNTVSYNYGSE